MQKRFSKIFHPADIFAGFTVAMVSIPQSMAYAGILEINPLYGLFTAIVPAMTAAFLGFSPGIITGPTNATALTTASVLASLASSEKYLEYVFVAAITSGLIKVMFGFLPITKILCCVPKEVLKGFLAGACLLIVTTQLCSIFGFARPAGKGTINVISHVVRSLDQTNIQVLANSIFTFAVMWLGRRNRRGIPAPLAALVISTLFVVLVKFNIPLIQDQGQIRPAISFHLPQAVFPVPLEIWSGSVSIALISLVETASIFTSCSQPGDDTTSINRDFRAQGFASIAGGFFQCFPPSSSLARSAVARKSGAVTRATGVFSGIFVLVSLILFNRWIGLIPISSLAVVVAVSALGIINFRETTAILRGSRPCAVIFILMLVCTLLLPLQSAILIGAVISAVGHIVLQAKKGTKVKCIEKEPGI